jgi:multiple sugar transport system substrate-binding protein
MRKSMFIIASLLIVLGTVLSACGTPATPAPVANTAAPVATAAPAALVATAAPEVGKTQVYWYIGLGAGSQPSQIPVEQAWIKKYNEGQGVKDAVQLIPIIVDNKYATDNLTAQIAAGNIPDIVGPIGTAGRASFPDSTWADLAPLLKKIGYDISKVDPNMLAAFNSGGKQIGIPFGVYPTVIFYNKSIFDAAGLKYPPQKIGDKYTMPDGSKVDWSFDTVAKIAPLMTLDKNGKNSTEAGFDANSIVQYGFDYQFTKDSPRAYLNAFDPHYTVGADGTASITDGQKAALKWYYEAMWGKTPFLPNAAASAGAVTQKGNSFNSGHLGMVSVPIWCLGCFAPPKNADGTPNKDNNVKDWDMAIIPTSPIDGKIHSRLNSDIFIMMAGSKNPEAAAKVYAYMIGAGGGELATLYGALPVDPTKQDAWFAAQDKKFAPIKPTWDVVKQMLTVLSPVDDETAVPNNNKSNTAWATLGSDLASKKGLDVDARIAQFIKDWNVILAAANVTPTAAAK